MRNRSSESPWTRVAYSTLVLLLASVVPSPLPRHEEWQRLGPDKLLHLLGHGGYAVTLADAFGANRCTNRDAAVIAICVSTLISFVTGRLQQWIPGRAFELADVVAGLLGSILAVCGWYVVNGSRNDGGR